MSKRVLTLVLAMALAVGIFGTVANAGVEGSFTFHISMRPQPREICHWDVPDVAVEAHAVKAAVDKLDFCEAELTGIEQPLLELADYTLPGDVAAIQAKVAEIKTDYLDVCKADLQKQLDAIPSDICTEVTADWVDELSVEIVDMFNEINTIVTKTEDFAGMSEWKAVEDALDTIKNTTPNPTTGWIEFDLDGDTQTDYVSVEDINEVKAEWEAFTATATALKDKAAKMYKKYALWEKYEDELHLAALDCTDPEGLDEVFTALTRLNNAAVELDLEIDEFLTEAQTIKDDYKKFLTKQVGLWDDEIYPVFVNDITNPVDIAYAWEAIAGPTTGAIYDINYEMDAVKTKKLAIEAKLDTIKAKYADQVTLAGYIADLDPIYADLDAISVKKWDWVCVTLPNREIQKFDFDFEGLLDLSFTFSGLTIGNDLAMGIGGMEHYILSIATTLGALDLKDEFWFAAPYDASGNVWGPMQFVKKRVDASITIGGLSLDTLVLFEDVNFTYPYTPPVLPPMYGFGAIFTLEGTTVSGISVKSVTGICADPQVKNSVKKHSAYGEVNKLCGLIALPTKAGGKSSLWFDVEKLYLSGIVVGPLTFDNYTEFRPFKPISNTLDIELALPAGITADFSLTSTNITSFLISSASYAFSLGDIASITFYDNNGDLTLGAGDLVEAEVTIAVQNATFDTIVDTVPTVGITALSIAADIPVTVGTFSAEVDFGAPALTMSAFSFAYATTVGDIDLSITSDFTMSGLDKAVIEIKVPFAV